MQEIEAKFYILDLDRIKSRLLSLEARLIQERVLETNIRFDLPGSGLSSKGQVLRLRQDTEARLTYKGSGTSDQGVLSRTEIEFTVEDFEKAKLFLEALGYQELFYYEKYRTTYILESASSLANAQKQASGIQSAHIMLDELPYGNFVEIEGENVEAVRGIAEQLTLNMDSAIPASYHMLFTTICKNHPDLNPADLSFKALQGVNVSAEDMSVHAADG